MTSAISVIPAIPETVVADLDTGIDDALALLWLAARHRAGAIDLHVTTSAGNTTVEQATRNSAEVLRIAGVSDVPVTAGAAVPRVLPLTITPETHGPEGLGYWVPQTRQPDSLPSMEPRSGVPTADDALAAWEAASPDRILVAGPATNLARAVECAPNLLRDTQVAVMSGAFLYPGNTTPTAEWNAWSDPHALAFCMEHWPDDSPLPIFCPLNVTEKVVLTPERLRAWTADLPGELGRFLEESLRFYMEFHQSVGVGYCAQIHDLAAALVMCEAVDVRLEEATVQVEVESALLRGTTVADWTGRAAQGERVCGQYGDSAQKTAWGPYWQRPANAQILMSLEPEDVLTQFIETVTLL